MTKVRKIFNIAYEILSTAVISVGLILAVLYLCGIRLYHVQTGSMGELLPVGCVCFVSTYSKFESIETGDVISLRAGDDMRVTHRAVRITAEGVYTRGDANETDDADPVTRGNYIGKTVFALPYLGKVLAFLHTVRGMILLGSIVLLLAAAGLLYRQKEE